ncbi:MAG: L,D-transpeptidase family protein [Gemmatirosa sp.]|nr:L,D-transpeptidase family protein [Gemmatirosa sp.]
MSTASFARAALAVRLLAWLLAPLALLASRPAIAQPPTSWLADGVPTAQARAAIDVLRDAGARGLRAADYDADALDRQARALGARDLAASDTDADVRVRFDAALTRSMTRFLHDLHAGRADPGALGFRLPDTHGHLDFAAMARDVSRSTDVAASIAAAEPPYAGYAALVRVLARYRALAADATLRPPNAPSVLVHAGQPLADAPALRRLLAALGDLASASPPLDSTRYDDALADGVRAFQRRHGLDPDGTLGPATMAALRVPAARRVRQIELTLERWRWLPDVPPARYVVVNVPAFRLYAFEDDPAAARPRLRMNVIVGRAEGHRHTPVFTATMRDVVFQPYWDVPPSIARNELLPRLRRDPDYARRDGFEIVQGGDDDARRYAVTGATLARVAAGTLRLRQRPGDGNALGPVKFVFPNAYNVYLHGTPARQLFAQTRRDFSHGCIRVEDPAALAELVLRGQAGWDRAAVDAAMRGGPTRRVAIERPLGVFVLYATVMPGDDGVVHFYPDIYGHDAALERALAAGPRRVADGALP